jgi:hypothetical protein
MKQHRQYFPDHCWNVENWTPQKNTNIRQVLQVQNTVHMQVPQKLGAEWEPSERMLNIDNQRQHCTIKRLTKKMSWKRWKHQFLYES